MLVVTCQSNHFDMLLREKMTVCHEFIFKCRFYMTIEHLLSTKNTMNHHTNRIVGKSKTNEAGTYVCGGGGSEEWTKIIMTKKMRREKENI